MSVTNRLERAALMDVGNIAAPGAVTRRMADVKPEPIRWLWFPRFALGKLSIIAGDPGLGKSMLTASFASHVTTGRKWPDGAQCPTGSVVLISGEDDPGDTIRPRLDKAGADVSRVHYLESVYDQEGIRGFSLAEVPALGGLLTRLSDCRLVVIDPLSAYLAGTDSHNNSDVRALLTPLSQLAAGHGVAIVAVSHLNKSSVGNALSRVTGSLAFVAAARAAYVIARDKEDPARRLMLPLKNNLGNDQTGMAYRIAEDMGVPFVSWEREPVTISAEEALAPQVVAPRDEAAEFLANLLERGPLSQKDIERRTAESGHAWRTIRRAKDRLGIISRRDGYGHDGGWSWELPREDGQIKDGQSRTCDLATFDESEQRRGLEAGQTLKDGQLSCIEKVATFRVCPKCAGEGCRYCAGAK